MLEREHLRHPHLMLPDVSRDNAIALRDVMHLCDHVMRRYSFAMLAVFVERLFLFPLQDLLMPLRPRDASLCDTLAILDDREHVAEHRFYVADDRNIDPHVLRDRRRIDIDMNDRFSLRRELGDLAGHAIVEARAHRNQAISIADCRVSAVRTVHPEHPEPERIR